MVRPGETLHSRPVAGIGKAVEIGSKDALEAYLSRFWAAGVTPVVTRSLLRRPLTQFSVGAAVARGEMLTVTARKIRPRADACRVGTLVETIDAADAEAIARQVLHALAYTGIAEVEILRTDDDGALHVIEVNARPWLQLDLGAASGRDLLGFLVSDGAMRPQGPARRSTWLDFSGDLYSCFNAQDGAVRRGRLSVAAYLRSLWRANVYARWSPADPLPFFLDAWQMLRLVFARLC
jgi:predicted ATP-grasp superfamily ATP-dependent carboligase